LSSRAGLPAPTAGSVAFHRRLGFEARQVPDYGGPGQPMMVMTRRLPWDL